MSNKQMTVTQVNPQSTQGMVVQGISPWRDVIKPELVKAEPMLARLAPTNFQKQIPRLVTALLAATKKTPQILECDPKTIVLALAQCASIGIVPNTPTNHAYLIPYGKELTLQLSYPGLIELAQRSQRVSKVRGVAVYRADKFVIHEGTDDRIIHEPALENRGTDADIIGAYGVIKYRDGSVQFRWLDRDAIEKRRAMSKSSNNNDSPWKKWYKEMAEKTAVKYVLKQCALSDDDDSEVLMKAVAHDDGEPIDVSAHYDIGNDSLPESTAVAGSLAAQAQ